MNGLGSARDTLRRVRFVFPDEIKGTNDMVYMHGPAGASMHLSFPSDYLSSSLPYAPSLCPLVIIPLIPPCVHFSSPLPIDFLSNHKVDTNYRPVPPELSSITNDPQVLAVRAYCYFARYEL